MKKEVIFVLLDQYADWEGAFLASALNTGVLPGGTTPYAARTLSPSAEGVGSLGGFRTVTDYTFDAMPEEWAALVLVGGMQWASPEAEKVAPIVEKTLRSGGVVGAICNAASFMASHGFLNDVKHTGNTVEQLKSWGGDRYTNEAGYVEAQAVSDGRIVTANGSGYLEFTREMLSVLKADTPENIAASYDFNKYGFIEFMKKQKA